MRCERARRPCREIRRLLFPGSQSNGVLPSMVGSFFRKPAQTKAADDESVLEEAIAARKVGQTNAEDAQTTTSAAVSRTVSHSTSSATNPSVNASAKQSPRRAEVHVNVNANTEEATAVGEAGCCQQPPKSWAGRVGFASFSLLSLIALVLIIVWVIFASMNLLPLTMEQLDEQIRQYEAKVAKGERGDTPSKLASLKREMSVVQSSGKAVSSGFCRFLQCLP